MATTARVAKAGAQAIVRHVAPVKSTTPEEARRAVLGVYKKFQRQAPRLWYYFYFQDIPMPVFREILKKQFTKHAHISDLRVIDRQVEECEMHMESIDMAYYNPDHVRNYLLRENVEPKAKDFLSKFLAGKD
jgi:hypothetical protein